MIGPLLTRKIHETLWTGARAGASTVECSLDLGRSITTVEVDIAGWRWRGRQFSYLPACKDATVYHWDGENFEPVARYATSLIKLVPTEWGPPTFQIDGVKMLPTAHVSPYADAERKVSLIEPRGKVVLDTCGGLGYFAAWCVLGQAKQVLSYEKNADVIWLRTLNPWSPEPADGLTLRHGDITEQIGTLPTGSVDAILHDPPRFGTAGELYSQSFYGQMARVIKRKGKLFHYTGAPNKLTSGRDVAGEVIKRLRHAGFAAALNGDGVLAVKQ